MPLAGAPLPPDRISVIKEWIDSGADGLSAPVSRVQTTDAVEKHWAYRPPVRPAVPAVPGPVHNAIDNFLLARLAKEGMDVFSAGLERKTHSTRHARYHGTSTNTRRN